MNRTKEGRLQADPKRFPSGIKRLADYVSHPIQFCILLSLLAKFCSLSRTEKACLKRKTLDTVFNVTGFKIDENRWLVKVSRLFPFSYRLNEFGTTEVYCHKAEKHKQCRQ